ncbi:MAG: hypothetical protein JWL75_37 [Parcubacteria group bacterium]|nr:hypothetical protein [Parcubacteria group bacterium]
MDWAKHREWMVITVLGAVVLAAIIILGFAIFYKTPTCTDGKMNGDETGIDCGGTSCSTICSAEAQPAQIRFARSLMQSGRSDLIAYIDNPNTKAYALNTHFTITIYRQDGHTLVRHAVLSIPSNSSTPLYIPGISSAPVQQVFVTFDPGYPVWVRSSADAKTAPKASNISVVNTDSRPVITAIITNQTAYPATNVPLIATVFDANGTVIAASQTVLPLLSPQSNTQAVFTWNEPFSAPYARVDIVPLIALPTLVP